MSIGESLTLAVDIANNGTTVDKVYTYFDTFGQKRVYHSADHTLVDREELCFIRRMPSRSGNFLGTAKGTIKFTDDVVVAGADGSDVKAPLIIEVSFSAPVGVTEGMLTERRQRVMAILDDDTHMGPFFYILEW